MHRNEEKYKELKSHYPMDLIPRANLNIVKFLIGVAILALMCSRRILRLIRNANPENVSRYTHFRLRWTNLKDYKRKRKERLKNWSQAFLIRRLKGSCELPLFLIYIHSNFCYGYYKFPLFKTRDKSRKHLTKQGRKYINKGFN